MKLLRFLLVIIIAGLIVLGLRKLTNTPDSEIKGELFGPIRERLTVGTQITSPTTGTTDDLVIDTTDSPDPSDLLLAQRVQNELIPVISTGRLGTSQYSSLLTVGTIYGNNNADYLMIEYCDYGIGYCQQAQQEGALIAYQEAMEGNLGYILKPLTLTNNKNEQSKHHALLCAQHEGTQTQVNVLNARLYETMTDNEIRKIGEELGIPGFESCLSNTDSHTTLINERAFARSVFQLSKLPTYVLVDTRSLEWTVIPGLFEEALVVEYLKGKE